MIILYFLNILKIIFKIETLKIYIHKYNFINLKMEDLSLKKWCLKRQETKTEQIKELRTYLIDYSGLNLNFIKKIKFKLIIFNKRQ